MIMVLLIIMIVLVIAAVIEGFFIQAYGYVVSVAASIAFRNHGFLL